MTVDLKIRKIGNSLGIVLPKELLNRLNVGEGDHLVLTESTDNGFRMTPGNGDFAEQMQVAEDVVKRYRNTLRELAK